MESLLKKRLFLKSKSFKPNFMKHLYFFVIALMISSLSFSQQHVSKTLQHGGLSRQYLEYVPTIYNGTNPVPLIICLHGLGDTMDNFKNIGLDDIADTANFIVLTPQAINSVLGTAWNSGASMNGMQLNQNVDDAGFIIALIDSTSAIYNIDPKRIYLTGFSMGSFMCHRMACEHGERIAAIASVAGTIGTAIQCNPSRPVPVIHFHGTADQTISYTANAYGLSVDTLLKYWVNANGCDVDPVFTEMPDVASDGFTVEHYQYRGGNAGSEVEHYKVIGADHQWIYTPTNDIDYTTLIWKFLSKYSLVQLGVNNINNEIVELYPNPANNVVSIILPDANYSIKLLSSDGRIVKQMKAEDSKTEINVSSLTAGIYFVIANNLINGKQIVRKLNVVR